MGRNREAPTALLQAAQHAEPFDERLARDLFLEAISALYASSGTEGTTPHEIGQAAVRSLEAANTGRTSTEWLLEAFATLICDGYPASVPALRSAAAQLRDSDATREELTRWFSLAIFVAQALWDEELFLIMNQRLERAAREHGALYALMVALSSSASYAIRAGRFAEAESRYSEHADVGRACGFPLDPALLEVELSAWQGDAQSTRSRAATLREIGRISGSAALDHHANLSLTILELALGNYEDALAAAQRVEDGGSPGWVVQALPGVIEAAVRSGHPDIAARALDRLVERVGDSDTPWALGALARCQALVTSDPVSAEALQHAAIQHFELSAWRTELARSHLLYGEWLRRQKRRIDAREQLRVAFDLFSSIGAMGFAERARLELLATGEHARSRRDDTRSDLTPRELQIAQLAAQRATSREIAAQLFISSNTVDYHLRKVFQKLGVTSRREIAGVLSSSGDDRALGAIVK